MVFHTPPDAIASGETTNVKIAIAILNWNGAALLREYLPSVMAHSGSAEIIVADNGSNDNSLSVLKTEFPTVRIIELKENSGFAGGYNRALQQIDADVFVLLNSDVMVTPGWLEAPLKRLANQNVAAVQPKILSKTNPNQFEHAGASGGFIDKMGFPFCRGRIFDSVEQDHGQYDTPMQVFWASGACMFVRAKAFNKAGGFSEAFFAHMEEIDLCWRFQRMGMQVWAEPSSTVYHLGGGTLNYMSPRKAYLNFRNSLFMLLRNDTGFAFGKIYLRLCIDALGGIHFLLQGKPRFMWEVIRAHFSFYARIPALLQERRQIKKLGNHKPIGRFNVLIPYRYFAKGIKKFGDLVG